MAIELQPTMMTDSRKKEIQQDWKQSSPAGGRLAVEIGSNECAVSKDSVPRKSHAAFRPKSDVKPRKLFLSRTSVSCFRRPRFTFAT